MRLPVSVQYSYHLLSSDAGIDIPLRTEMSFTEVAQASVAHLGSKPLLKPLSMSPASLPSGDLDTLSTSHLAHSSSHLICRCLSILPVCVCAALAHLVSSEIKRGIHIPWDWSYR